MSDPIVIALVENRLIGGLDPFTEPFLKTLNARPILPPQYVSLERDYSAVDRISLSQPLVQFRETGSLTAVVNVRAGQGTETAEVLAEKIRDLFHNYAVDHFRVEVVNSAAVFESDDGNYFQLKIAIQYQFDFFKP